MTSNGGAPFDPFFLQQDVQIYGPQGPGYYNLAGKTQVDPRLVGGELTKTFLFLGQSNVANSTNVLFDPGVAKAQNLCVNNGAIYQAKDPLLGAGSEGGCWVTRFLADMISAGACQRTIGITPAVVSSAVNEWSGEITTPIRNMNHRIGVAARRAANVGLTIDATIWMQGETDNLIATSQVAYSASLALVISSIRAAGISTPILIGKCTGLGSGGVFTVSSAVQAAQVAAVNNPAGIYAGADSDSLGLAYRNGGTHFSNAGASDGIIAVSALWVTAVRAALGI